MTFLKYEHNEGINGIHTHTHTHTHSNKKTAHWEKSIKLTKFYQDWKEKNRQGINYHNRKERRGYHCRLKTSKG